MATVESVLCSIDCSKLFLKRYNSCHWALSMVHEYHNQTALFSLTLQGASDFTLSDCCPAPWCIFWGSPESFLSDNHARPSCPSSVKRNEIDCNHLPHPTAHHLSLSSPSLCLPRWHLDSGLGGRQADLCGAVCPLQTTAQSSHCVEAILHAPSSSPDWSFLTPTHPKAE